MKDKVQHSMPRNKISGNRKPFLARAAISNPIRGVYKCGLKWKSQIQIDGKQHYLGIYHTIEQASEAYKSASKSFGRMDFTSSENSLNNEENGGSYLESDPVIDSKLLTSLKFKSVESKKGYEVKVENTQTSDSEEETINHRYINLKNESGDVDIDEDVSSFSDRAMRYSFEKSVFPYTDQAQAGIYSTNYNNPNDSTFDANTSVNIGYPFVQTDPNISSFHSRRRIYQSKTTVLQADNNYNGLLNDDLVLESQNYCGNQIDNCLQSSDESNQLKLPEYSTLISSSPKSHTTISDFNELSSNSPDTISSPSKENVGSSLFNEFQSQPHSNDENRTDGDDDDEHERDVEIILQINQRSEIQTKIRLGEILQMLHEKYNQKISDKNESVIEIPQELVTCLNELNAQIH